MEGMVGNRNSAFRLRLISPLPLQAAPPLNYRVPKARDQVRRVSWQAIPNGRISSIARGGRTPRGQSCFPSCPRKSPSIKKATGGDAESYDEIRYEGYGPGGVAVIVEAMTDNRNRTASNVRSTFTKSGGNLGETGSVGFMFERKGQVTYAADVGDADTVMMAAIEAGAEDVESSEEGHVIWCADTDLNEVSTALEAALGESVSTKLVWQPQTTTELDLEGAQKLMKLIEALEDDDDVQSVTANFEISDEVMAQL